ncbi:MAG: hypothetical protein U9P12_00240, partial [Verrucomicrobiota bacterium]|nr:hypothetical protein [Verrucomicrobiota bacterium]
LKHLKYVIKSLRIVAGARWETLPKEMIRNEKDTRNHDMHDTCNWPCFQRFGQEGKEEPPEKHERGRKNIEGSRCRAFPGKNED